MKHTMLLAACFSVAAATSIQADEVAPTDVVFSEYGAVEASLTGVAGDPANGRTVFINRKLGNCLACHSNAEIPEQLFHGQVGPTLDGVADRYDADALRGLLANSKNTFDGTIMPAFYIDDGYTRNMEKFAGKPILTAQQVEDVLAYILTLSE